MSKSAVIALVVVVVVLAGGGALLATHKKSNDTTQTSTSSTENMDMSSTSQNSSSTPTATSSVAIDNFAFSPASITVKKGTKVTWTNKDSATHTVTSTSGPMSFDSGDLPNGKSFSFTFDTAGTYKYKCSIHPDMTGTVTVTE